MDATTTAISMFVVSIPVLLFQLSMLVVIFLQKGRVKASTARRIFVESPNATKAIWSFGSFLEIEINAKVSALVFKQLPTLQALRGWFYAIVILSFMVLVSSFFLAGPYDLSLEILFGKQGHVSELPWPFQIQLALFALHFLFLVAVVLTTERLSSILEELKEEEKNLKEKYHCTT